MREKKRKLVRENPRVGGADAWANVMPGGGGEQCRYFDREALLGWYTCFVGFLCTPLKSFEGNVSKRVLLGFSDTVYEN